MSCDNNSVKCVKNISNLNDEKTIDLNAGKASNESNFWELITDVAKDLDLALQDLSPDLEINSIDENGIVSENAGSDRIGTEEPSDTLLLESTPIRTTGNNSQQNAVQRQSDTQSVDNTDISAEVSLDKSRSLLQTDCSSLLPTFTAHSVAVSSKASYSLQLLSLMDNFQISKESDFGSKVDTISICDESQVKSDDKESRSGQTENVSNPSAESVSEDKNEDHSGASCESIPAVIGLLERLIRCHPIWFLPEIGRAGVVHLLQGKEPGCFIVRQSSKANTMALSVRLPEGKGPHVEHYLIEDGGNSRLHLEGSDNYFSAIPMLVCHYCNCCDELPVQLTLPKVLDESNRQQLTSLALLGQDFWQSSLSKLTNSNAYKTEESSSSSVTSGTTRTNSCSTFKSETKANPPPIPPKQEIPNLDPLIDIKKSSTVPISQVISQTNPKIPPKTVRPDPPPVPPRSKFVTINNNPNSNQSSISQPLNGTNVSNNDSDNQSTKSSVSPKTSPRVSPTVAPNTEFTLIQMNDMKSARSSGLTSNSSQTTDNQPKEAKKSPPIAQKQVLCYRSSLHDKESDYEDIWGANTLNKIKLKQTLYNLSEDKVCNQCNRSTQTETTMLVKNRSDHRSDQLSNYYIDPIDAIPKGKHLMKGSVMRRSDTDINDSKPTNSSQFGHSMESLIDSIRCESTQIDTCQQIFCSFNPNLSDLQVQVGCSTFSRHQREVRESSWPLDKSWKWLDDNLSALCGHSFKRSSFASCRRSSLVESMKSDITTVEDLIILQTPELSVPKGSQLFPTDVNGANRREDVTLIEDMNDRYDNLAIYRNNNEVMPKQEVINDTDTEFSEPWDSDWWEGLIKKVFPRNALIQFSPEAEENYFLLNRERTANNCENSSTFTSLSDSRITSTFDITEVSSIASMPQNRDSTASDRLTVLETNDCGIGLNICNYIFELSAEGNNTFAKAIDHFIECTKDSAETNPLIVMRNIRQFMNGMKNYLVKHGEGELTQMIDRQRTKLKPNEFLNIDAILESALHRLVIKPLKNFLYQLFITEYTRNGSLKVLSQNIKEAQTKTPQELGVRPELLSIDSKTMNEIQKYLSRLQKSYSPLKKLEYLLATISTIYNNIRTKLKKRSPNESNGQSKSEYASFGADDFIPVLIYVLIQCGMISAEIEVDYMFGLLQSSILVGEGGYYLTTMSSAVHVLKNMQQLSGDCNTTNSSTESSDISIVSNATPVQRMNSSSSETSVTSTSLGQSSPYTLIKLPIIANLKAYMKIMIPDEFTSNIATKTLPIRPNMMTKEVCKMIAHKFKITNAEDFGLFKVINGEELQLNDTDLPQVIKAEAMATGLECQFAYKRFDAKFIWPLNKH